MYPSGVAAAQTHEELVLENVSSRHTFYYSPARDESLKVYASGNDGIRLYLNGKLMVDRWNGFSWNKENFLYDFEAGRVSESYYENVDRIRSRHINPYSRVGYCEGLFVGYRGYQKNGVEPLFPFGFGLTYTTFEYSDIAVRKDADRYVLTFNVRNTRKVCSEATVWRGFV